MDGARGAPRDAHQDARGQFQNREGRCTQVRQRGTQAGHSRCEFSAAWHTRGASAGGPAQPDGLGCAAGEQRAAGIACCSAVACGARCSSACGALMAAACGAAVARSPRAFCGGGCGCKARARFAGGETARKKGSPGAAAKLGAEQRRRASAAAARGGAACLRGSCAARSARCAGSCAGCCAASCGSSDAAPFATCCAA